MILLKSKKYLYIFGLFFAFILGSILTTFIVQVLAHGGNTNFIHGCVDGRGNIARVGESENCLTGETAVDWTKGIGEYVSTNFSGEDLGGMDFRYRNLTGFDLSNTGLGDTNFSHANLTNADLSGSTFNATQFLEANLTGADLSGNHFLNVNFEDAIFTGTTRTGVTWENTTCPDGTNSDSHGNTCEGYLTP